MGGHRTVLLCPSCVVRKVSGTAPRRPVSRHVSQESSDGLDTAEFYNCVIKWIQEIDFVLKDKVVSIDGKTLRGSHDRANGQAPLHV